MRKALGKGIHAIIPEETQQALNAEARLVKLEQIRPNPFQPRQRAAENLDELVASIREKGVLQPVLVRPRREGYELVMGERRFRAAQGAGLEAIPALVRSVSDREMLELALVENLQRENLNPIEEAAAYKRLVDEFSMTHEAVAERVGKDRSTVTNAVRLLSLPYKVRDALAAGRLSAGHARPLLALASRREQVSIAERIASEGLSVRAVERLCSARAEKALPLRPTSPEPKEPDVHVGEIEERLQERLGTRVRVYESKGGRGRLVVEFFSLEDLNRIVRLIGG